MVIALLAILAIIDIGLMAAVVFLGKRQIAHVSMIEDLTEERRMIGDLRAAIHEEMQIAAEKNRKLQDRVSHIAAEAEQEVKVGREALSKEMDTIVNQLSARFEEPLKEINKKQAALEALMKKADQEKVVLQSMISRGEKICRFFDKRIPYEEVLQEIEDKKYADARHLISQGIEPRKVAQELGLTESEVKLVAGFSIRQPQI